MKRKLDAPRLVRATMADYPVIQNMARFYVYDMSRYCGFISPDWACPSDGLYESFDYKSYLEQPDQYAFLVKIQNELAGFVLFKKLWEDSFYHWKISEFFILAKFQGYGIAEQAAHQVWRTYPGPWELTVIPENIKALRFWRKAVGGFTRGNFTEEIILVDHDRYQPHRYLLSFDA